MLWSWKNICWLWFVCCEVVYFVIVVLVWSGPVWSGLVWGLPRSWAPTSTASPDNPVKWTHALPSPFVRCPAFAWQAPVAHCRTRILPGIVQCVLCACDLREGPRKVGMPVFPYGKERLSWWHLPAGPWGSSPAPRPLPTPPGIPGHPQRGLQTCNTACTLRPRSQCSRPKGTFGLSRGKASSTFGQGLALPRG